ncbi:DUF1499 domain-containing protein [Yoonia sp. SS1-5]|uniref:DUF1499 domain-containing protein n=1 Tax=Yoonia rhodophyticola TaxID=3137370 RepID=A0AAN0NJJ8_9RHOB
MRILSVLLLLALGLIAYVRLVPTQAAKWHVLPDVAAPGDVSGLGSFLAARRLTSSAEDALTAVERRALATPRTKLIKGSVAEGLLTFQTRSAVIGFPDYTTVGVRDDLLIIYGRLRFGQSDLGVNRARVAGWLETLGPLTEPL